MKTANRTQAGFTLIELTAATAAVAIAITFLPAVQRLRENHNRTVAEQTLRAIGSDLTANFRKTGKFPTSLDEVMHGSGGGGGAGLIPRERKAGGYQFIAVELSPTRVRLAAEPIAGVTGSMTGFLEAGANIAGPYTAINFAKTSGADQGRKKMFDEAYHSAAIAIGRLIGLSTAADGAAALKGLKADAENALRRAQVFNSLKGPDGKTGFGSIHEYLMTSQTDSSPKAIFQALAQDSHRSFRLGALGENITLLPSMSVPDAPEITQRLLNFTRLAESTVRAVVDPNVRLIIDPNDRYVIDPNERSTVDPNVVNAMLGWLSQARAADSKGDIYGRQKTLTGFIGLLADHESRQFHWGVTGTATPNAFVPHQSIESLSAIVIAMK